MVNRRAIAKHFAERTVHSRDDIVAILLLCPASIDHKGAVEAVDLIKSYMSLQGPEVAELKGIYMPRKAMYLAECGRIREAIGVLWPAIGWQAIAPENQDKATALLNNFVELVGWNSQESRAKQALLAEEIVDDLVLIVDSTRAN